MTNAALQQPTIHPTHPPAGRDFEAKALYHRASELRLQGNIIDALPLYRQALELWPDFAECLNDYGLLLLMREEFPEALSLLQRAVRLLPDNATAHRNLGEALGLLGRFPEALAHLQVSLRLDPTSADTAHRLAWCQYEAGILDCALDWAAHTLQLNPAHVPARFLRGEILLHGGEYQAGWHDFESRLLCCESPNLLLSACRWRGESLTGKSLLEAIREL